MCTSSFTSSAHEVSGERWPARWRRRATPFVTRPETLFQRSLQRFHRGVIVWLAGHFRNIFGVHHFAARVQHKYGPAFDLEFLDQRAPILAEIAVLIIAAYP